MDSCGFPTPGWQRQSDRILRPDRMNRERLCKLLVRAVVGMAFFGQMAACAPTMKYGSLPRTDRLETLKPGVSTTADVLLTLGEPRGHGAARFPVDPVALEIWFYEYTYTKAGAGRVDLKILLVYFHDKRYAGHLWFSSAVLLDVAE